MRKSNRCQALGIGLKAVGVPQELTAPFCMRGVTGMARRSLNPTTSAVLGATFRSESLGELTRSWLGLPVTVWQPPGVERRRKLKSGSEHLLTLRVSLLISKL
jgi:hypothetical protein